MICLCKRFLEGLWAFVRRNLMRHVQEAFVALRVRQFWPSFGHCSWRSDADFCHRASQLQVV